MCRGEIIAPVYLCQFFPACHLQEASLTFSHPDTRLLVLEVDMRLMRVAVLLILAIAHGHALDAQTQETSPPKGQVRIQIVGFSGAVPKGLILELRNSRSGTPRDIAQISGETFEFTGLDGETFQLTITNEKHEFVHQQWIAFGGNIPTVIVPITEHEHRPAAEALISTRQLLIPAKAVEELGRSEKAFKAGDAQSSIAHLEKALRIYPDYLEAHNNLATRYIFLDQYDKAVTECEKAITIDSNSVKPHQNLSVALSLLRRYPDAEAEARRALQLDPNSAHIKYLLGRILAAQEQNTSEAVELLRQSASAIPNARMLLAQVLVNRGATHEAAAELREYLKSPNPQYKKQAQCGLAQFGDVFDGLNCERSTAPR